MSIWSVAERSRKMFIGFDDMQITGHPDIDNFSGNGIRRTSGVQRIFSG